MCVLDEVGVYLLDNRVVPKTDVPVIQEPFWLPSVMVVTDDQEIESSKILLGLATNALDVVAQL